MTQLRTASRHDVQCVTAPKPATRRKSHFIVAQIGARMHYAVPRILLRAGLLNRFYTDLYFPKHHWIHSWTKALLPGRIAGKIERYRTDIPETKVRYNNYDGLTTKIFLARARHQLHCADAYVRSARRLARMIARNETDLADLQIYGFDIGSLELFEWAAPRGGRLVLEQCISPRLAQERVLSNLFKAAGIPVSTDQCAAWKLLAEREQKEWRLANWILCPSEQVVQDLVALGVSPDKLFLVPYGVSPPLSEIVQTALAGRRKNRERPFRVLFAGEIGIRKGILDLWAAAGHLNSQEYEFVAAGPISLPSLLVDRLRQRITLLGACARAELSSEYAKADCFVLPSHLEGSATVTYEALGWGLPVVTTFASGSVVETGKSGFVGNAGDIAFLAESIRRLGEDRTLWEQMSAAAISRSKEFTVEKYGERLLAALDGNREL